MVTTRGNSAREEFGCGSETVTHRGEDRALHFCIRSTAAGTMCECFSGLRESHRWLRVGRWLRICQVTVVNLRRKTSLIKTVLLLLSVHILCSKASAQRTMSAARQPANFVSAKEKKVGLKSNTLSSSALWQSTNCSNPLPTFPQVLLIPFLCFCICCCVYFFTGHAATDP